MGNVSFEGFLYLIFLVFSVYKNPKSNHHLLFLAIFPDMEMFWSVNYIWQVCNYTFILDMSSILDNIYIWVFLVNSESILLLAFVKYMLCRHFTENCIFCTFWSLKILVLWQKIVQIFSYLCNYFVQKTAQLILKNFHNSGTVGRRKLADPSLNRIFNALSIGAQYTLLFQWTNFGLKCPPQRLV